MSQDGMLLGTLFSGLIGAAVGSFLNVVVLRTASKEKFTHGRSKCPTCGHTLSWYELIPVISFLGLGGRCRSCKKTLSLQYLIVETVTAAVFMAAWVTFGYVWMTPIVWVVSSAMICIALYDARWSLIPDSFTITLGIVALGALLYQRADPLDHVVGVGIGLALFGLQYLLSRGQWIGSGDIFLGGVLGGLLGWRATLGGFALAYILGAIFALPLLLKKHQAKQAIPFGPFLLLGAWVAWLWGPALWQWYLLHL